MQVANLTFYNGLYSVKEKIDNAARFLVCVSLFFLPVSTSLNALVIAASVLVLFGNNIKRYLPTILKQPLFWSTAGLIFLFIIGVLYNTYDTHYALHACKKYCHKLLSFLLLMMLFDSPIWRRRAINTVIATSLIIAFCATLQYYNLIDFVRLFNKPQTQLLSEIPWSIYCSFSLYFILTRLLTEQNNRFFYLLLWILLFVYSFYINHERTGMVLILFLTAFSLGQNNTSKKQRLIALLFLITMFSATLLSPTVQQRINHIRQDITQYQKGLVNTSLGLRFSFFTHSLTLIKEKPIFGHGTGSFPYAYEKTHGPKLAANELLGDPHQSFVHITVQLGIFGLFVFLVWLLTQWQLTKRLPLYEKKIAQGLILAFVLSALSVSAFYRTRISTLYLTLMATMLGAQFDKRKNDIKQI